MRLCRAALSPWNSQTTTTRNEFRGQVQAAFTLIELMVVMVLIGILTAMIIPEMKGTYEDALLRSTSRELVNACSLAYSRAVSFNQTCRVRLDLSTGRYAVEKHVWDNGREIYVPLRDVPGGEGKLDTRISIEVRPPDQSLPAPPGAVAPSDFADASQHGGREVVIGFYPDGTADAQDLVLTDRQGFRLALRINPITSRVNVVELDRELASASTAGGAR